MIVVIFHADIREPDDEYLHTAATIRKLAKDKYACLKFTSVMEENLEISISYWPDEQAVKDWKQDPEHLNAQALGKNKWYKNYRVEVLSMLREYDSRS